MNKKRKIDLFWASYADLMTSLFFVMLILFVVSIVIINITTDNAAEKIKGIEGRLSEKEAENVSLKQELLSNVERIGTLQDTLANYKVREEDYQKLLNLENTFRSLSANGSLRYDERHRTFIAKDFEGIEIFDSQKASISKKYLPTVDKVGEDLQTLLYELNKESNGLISYVLIIEGNTANTWDHQYDANNEASYLLSFQRAMALYKRWLSKGINLRQYNTEIQICGSGMNGINRDMENEENNKRFVIQIIPKVSRAEHLD